MCVVVLFSELKVIWFLVLYTQIYIYIDIDWNFYNKLYTIFNHMAYITLTVLNNSNKQDFIYFALLRFKKSFFSSIDIWQLKIFHS